MDLSLVCDVNRSGDRPVEILEAPETLFGEDVLVGFEPGVRFLWQ